MDNVVAAYKGYLKHLEMYKDKYVPNCFEMKIYGEKQNGVISPSADVVKQLITRNREKVIDEIKQGNRNVTKLLEVISEISLDGVAERVMDFTFIGVRITTDCNLYGRDRCKYCDQKHYKGKLDISVLKEIIESISYKGRRKGINVSLSGGEPLLLFEDLFGRGELIKCFSENGFVVNMNSNLHLITPQNVLPIINSGLASIHTSFDSSVEYIHDKLVCNGAMNRAIEGIKSIQAIKRIFGVWYPVLHINVVATKENLLLYDKLLEFLLQYRMPQKVIGLGTPYTNPGRMDLSPHLIPLGGERNKDLMPSSDDWNAFEKDILPRCRDIWNNYLIENGIKLTRKNSFDVVHYYSNPLKFNSVDKVNEKKDFKSCYIAPSQIYIVNNGDCYACGCHADIKDAPILGNIFVNSVDEIIKRNIHFLTRELPHPKYCIKCAKNTRKLNMMVENRLIANIQSWIEQEEKNKEYEGLL